MNTPATPPSDPKSQRFRVGPDWPFYLAFGLIGGVYVILIVALLVADMFYTTPGELWASLQKETIRYSIQLSLLSCTVTMILSVIVSIPIGYLLSRKEFFGKAFLDALLDIPIVLPPLVIGLSLLILFQTPIGKGIEKIIPVTYEIPSVILAQFTVACAFSVRTMRSTFDQISPRKEQVALTLGCSRWQAFWYVTLPAARRGLLTAATLAWARSLGEFGPILVFSGATPMRTEVLSTTVFLELTVGDISAAVAVSLLMVIAAVTALILIRTFGMGAAYQAQRI